MTPTAYRRLAAEADIQAGIRQLLTLCGIPHTVTDAGHDGRPGRHRPRVDESWPDLTGCLPPAGRMFAFECKSARGKLRPGQAERLAELRAAGALVLVPRTLREVAEALAAAGVDHPAVRELLK
jgi:hypothetical protein